LSEHTILHHSDLRLRRDGIRIGEVDLERHGNETVRERQEQISRDGSGPAPANELWEFERRMALRRHVLHVDGHVEREAEE
jgi:prepilin-type processing-associated H-X9-DG protein